MASRIQEAQALLAASHVESEDDLKVQKAFFEREDGERLVGDLLECSSALERTLVAEEKERADLLNEVQRLSDAWREVHKSAPGHLAKMEFRLAEQGRNSIENLNSGLSFKIVHIMVIYVYQS